MTAIIERPGCYGRHSSSETCDDCAAYRALMALPELAVSIARLAAVLQVAFDKLVTVLEDTDRKLGDISRKVDRL